MSLDFWGRGLGFRVLVRASLQLRFLDSHFQDIGVGAAVVRQSPRRCRSVDGLLRNG